MELKSFQMDDVALLQSSLVGNREIYSASEDHSCHDVSAYHCFCFRFCRCFCPSLDKTNAYVVDSYTKGIDGPSVSMLMAMDMCPKYYRENNLYLFEM